MGKLGGGEGGCWHVVGASLHLLLSVLGIMLSLTHFLCVCFFGFLPFLSKKPSSRDTLPWFSHSVMSRSRWCNWAKYNIKSCTAWDTAELTHTYTHTAASVCHYWAATQIQMPTKQSLSCLEHIQNHIWVYCLMHSNGLNNYFTYCSSFWMFPLTF